ncbi:putative peptidase C45 [Septoria linicola]|nr:putative peptidase C45 [Septoria linicola]
MLQIECSGSPREAGRLKAFTGFTHGQKAKEHISRSIAFYTWQFQDSAKLSWAEVRKLASRFEPTIRDKWPAYHEEMQGIAEGAGLDLEDIIAINVRTEITFGLFSDGCTALSWRTSGNSWLAQNWDWNPRQQENLVQLSIEQAGKPTIKMMTEAGLIGKIGLNSAGVGVCLNAIKAKGMDPMRLPCHLGLRMVLESTSRDDAVQKLESVGIASACHMLVADASGGIGLEWSASGLQKVLMNQEQQIFHSNHFLIQHQEEDTNWLADSNFRVARIEELAKEVRGQPTADDLYGIFKDTSNWPGAICRSAKGENTSQTLFNIVMDLEARRASVTVGRPVEPAESFDLSFAGGEARL